MSNTPPVALATSVFQTGPTDLLKTVDVYAAIAQDPVNSLVAAAEAGLGEAVGAVLGLPNVKSLLTKVDGALNQAVTSASQAVNRVESVVGGAISNLASLPANLVGSLTQAVGVNASALAGAAMGVAGVRNPNNPFLQAAIATSVTYGGTTYRRNVADVQSLSALTQVFQSVNPSSSLSTVVNQDQHTVMTALAHAAIPYRIPGLIDELSGQFTDQRDKTRFLVGLTGVAAAAGALDVINSAVATAGAPAVLAANPGLPNQILNGYTFPPDTPAASTANATDLYNALVGVDPNWDNHDRNGTPVTNLEAYSTASPDAQQCFAMLPQTQVPMMIAGNYPKTDLLQTAQEAYPMAPILFDTTSTDSSLSA